MDNKKFSKGNQFVPTLRDHAKNNKNNITLKLRQMTPGYNNNEDFSLKKIKQFQDEAISEFKENGYKNDQIFQQQIKLSDPIYRLLYTMDSGFRRIINDLKKQIESLGIQLPSQIQNQKEPENSIYYILGQTFKIYEDSQQESVNGFYKFQQKFKQQFQKEHKIKDNEQAFSNIERIFLEIIDRRSQIMVMPISDEKFSDMETQKFEFGTDGHASILMKKYQDSYSYNQEPNKVDFIFSLNDDDQVQEQNVQQIFQGEKNYIKEFYENYKDFLVKKSPEYWQFLIYDLLRAVCDKNLDAPGLQLKLMQMLDNQEEPVKYLCVLRKEIVRQLHKQGFGKRDEQIEQKQQQALLQDSGTMNNYQVLKVMQMDERQLSESLKEGQKNKSKGGVDVHYDHDTDQLIRTNKSGKPAKYQMDEQFSDLDFLKMEQNQILKYIPTLQKNDYPEYLIFRIDPIPRMKSEQGELVETKTLPEYAKITFDGIKALNRIQSFSFQVAFNTDDNILLSAPTGAGKTNVALLAILREVQKHLGKDNKVTNSDFKIVYLSPMKALASEITEKFQQRLGPLGIHVKECTGDMQLTKTEMEETQIIITTPEKWDVITRKTNQVADQLQLLIIDEIHLLNDDRGSVLECLIARTLQYIERNQRNVRLFGISATMPNYLDVAAFLHVKKENVFFFDHRYRPVPLLQKFIGVKNPAGSGKGGMRKTKKDVYNELMYDNALGVLKHKKQVLVFVHSRKETTTTGQYFAERAKKLGDERMLKQSGIDTNNLPKIQDKNLQKLIPLGIGFHHAGMLRKDRNLVEKMFLDGTIRILCATSTLAWGVNLPAYQVIIKGTDVYDSGKGGIQNLSVLDVQQMFGRAGRPQFDDNGEAILMTDYAKVGHYMGQLNNASYLESKLTGMIKEALNAEIVLGNVTSSKEAFDWINHTFYSVRIRRNPIQYGCRIINTVNKELKVEIHISELLEDCLKQLDRLRLIRYDRNSGYLSSTELGRITSHYYIKCDTMEIFCKQFGLYVEADDDTAEAFKQKRDEYKTDLDILKILAQAKEFENIKYRGEEYQELQNIFKYHWILEETLDLFVTQQKESHNKNLMVNEMIIETPDKILALLSGYLSRLQRYDNFSLVSDTQFVVQNAARLLRCLLDLVMMKNMAFNTEILLRWCKLLENRMAMGESPLRQFCRENFQGFNAMKLRKENKEGFLHHELVRKIEDRELCIQDIKEMGADELSYSLNVKKVVANVVKKFAYYLPEVEVEYKIKPVAQTVLQMDVQITPKWNYSGRWHSSKEIFWLMVDNEEEILYKDTFTVTAKQQYHKSTIELSFFLPFRDANTAYYRLSISSNNWIVDPEYTTCIELQDIYIKGERMDFTELLDLNPLPISVFDDPAFSSLYKIKYLNANQSQVFHALFHSNENVLIGSPTGSGKTMMAEFAVLRAFKNYPATKVVYVAPMKAIAKERLSDWDQKFRPLGKYVLELTGDYTPNLKSLLSADVLITTPEKWDGISRNWNNRAYTQQVSLLIFDEIHLLGQDRGPVIEVIVSRMNLIASRTGKKCRMLGLSTAMANGTDVAEWFGVPKFFFFNFRPHIRPVPITIYFDGFSEKAYCPRMGTMNKPAFNAIKKHSDDKPVIIFVSSRRQTRLTALDLISFAMQETGGESSRYVKCQQEELDLYISQVQDEYLIQTLTFGIGMHHAGLSASDRKIVEDLFLKQKIQVLVATSTLAWGVNLPARLVIVKGTEFFDPKSKRYVDMPVTDILQMIGRAGRPQFDDKGIACVYVEQTKKNFYRQYLNDPFPIESALLGQLHDHINAEIANGTISNKQQCLDWITWTYFFRRLLKNPSFYGMENAEPETVKKFLVELVDKTINQLKEHAVITVDEEDEYKLEPTFLGGLGALYYIKHESMYYFSQKITNDISIPDLIRVIAYADEFQGVPVRHNEDNLNEELSTLCPLKCNKKAMDSPHEKTYLLFQAHLFRLPLPIRDYLTDTKLVLDSTIRIIHCLIDLAAERQYLQTVLNLMLLMQMIMQGVWFDQSALVNIPYLEGKNLQKLGFFYLCELAELQARGRLMNTLNKKLPELNEQKKQQIISAVKTIPNVTMKTNIKPFDSDEMQEVEKDLPLKEGEEASLSVNLFRENFNEQLRVQVQTTSKIKDASWWVIVGNEKDDKVLGLKKVYFDKNVTKKFQIELPEDFEENPYLTVFLISDSYLGIDQVQKINLKKEKKGKKDHYI